MDASFQSEIMTAADQWRARAEKAEAERDEAAALSHQYRNESERLRAKNKRQAATIERLRAALVKIESMDDQLESAIARAALREPESTPAISEHLNKSTAPSITEAVSPGGETAEPGSSPGGVEGGAVEPAVCRCGHTLGYHRRGGACFYCDRCDTFESPTRGSHALALLAVHRRAERAEARLAEAERLIERVVTVFADAVDRQHLPKYKLVLAGDLDAFLAARPASSEEGQAATRCNTCGGTRRVWLCVCGWATPHLEPGDVCDNCARYDDLRRQACPDCPASSEVK
jgi:hypothetical protein